MALDKRSLDPTSSGSKGVKTLGTYQEAATLAAMSAANYFNGAAEELARVGVLMLIGSDGVAFKTVSISAGVVTLAPLSVAAALGTNYALPAALGAASTVLKVNGGGTALEFAADAT